MIVNKWSLWLMRMAPWIAGAVILAGVFFRFYRLEFPDKQVFDEVYFPVFAQNYLTGTDFYDVHPPLGKFVIALGIALFGDNGFGWRIIPALVGVANIVLFGFLAKELFKSKVAGWLAAMLVATDGLFLIYSRVGLMDGFLTFMIFLTLYVALRVPEKSYGMVWVGLLFGLAVAVKWPALALLLPLGIIAWRKKLLGSLVSSSFIGVCIYMAIVILGQYLVGSSQPISDAFQWHNEAFNYHATLKDTHPWGSVWWTWVVPLKPVLFIYDVSSTGQIAMMTSLGNPILWWISALAVLGTLVSVLYTGVKRKLKAADPRLVLLVGYLIFWLPWAGVNRVLFLYHYFPSYAFGLLLTVYWAVQGWKTNIWYIRSLVIVLLAACMVSAVVYLPWAVGWITRTQEQVDAMRLIQSWL